MSYYGDYWKPREPRADHEKAWRRARATEWDPKWHALSRPARDAFLNQIKGPAREGSQAQPSTPADRVPAGARDELAAAGFVRVEPVGGKRSPRVVPEAATYDFSARVRSMHRYRLLGTSDREGLGKFIKYAYYSNGEPLINRVLRKAGAEEGLVRLDEALEHHVTSARWPDWAAASAGSRAAPAVLDALRKARGPVPMAGLAGLVKKAGPGEVAEALEGLIIHLGAFEDVDPGTLDLVVGLLPIVRERAAESGKPRARPPLVALETPAQVGPPGGLAVNDLRVFLLEMAGESPRLRQDGGIFQKDWPRFEAALPEWPGWLLELLATSNERRVEEAYSRARTLGFVEAESDERITWLRLSGKGRNWLAAGLEQQYRILYEWFRAYGKKADPFDYGFGHGDSRFLGISLTVTPATTGTYSYYDYREIRPEERQARRDAIYEAFAQLPVGVYHRWDSVLGHLAFEDQNPLIRAKDAAKGTIHLDQRTVSKVPERREEAGKQLLDAVLRKRLLPFDAVRPAVDAEGRLYLARLPRLDGYFGRDYDAGEGTGPAATRVIVQPDFSVMVIGLDPAPAAELAPFCERTRGQLGEGAITFRITRDSVVRAASQGLTARAIVSRLRKHASIEVPANVLGEVQGWADRIRRVNVRAVTVVRCPDAETAARVVAALGRKAEPLGGSMVALPVPRLSAAEREKLHAQGIIVTKDDITPDDGPPPEAGPDPTPAAPKKARGRPRKAR